MALVALGSSLIGPMTDARRRLSNRLFTASLVLMLIASALVLLDRREQEFAWETCEAPRIEGVTMLADLNVGRLVGGSIQAFPVADLEFAVAMATRADDPSLYVTTLTGVLFELPPEGEPVPRLDLSEEVLVGDEQGLLGLDFSPDGTHAYLTFTDQGGTLHLVEYSMPDFGDRRQVLTVPQPQRWHNGGNLRFGPDGYLYLGLGDGGSTGDQYRNGQNLDAIYGTIVRIDPRQNGAKSYRTPDDNPFIDGAVPEIFAYGLRNPWTFGFDSDTGDLWIADVGQNCVEELDLIPAASGGGENFGWSTIEGNMRVRDRVPDNHVPPILAYAHETGGCAIVGGGVYDGSDLPELRGRFLFADYCRGRIMAATLVDGVVTAVDEIGVDVPLLTGFGVDAAGEVYLMTRQDGVQKLDRR